MMKEKAKENKAILDDQAPVKLLLMYYKISIGKLSNTA